MNPEKMITWFSSTLTVSFESNCFLSHFLLISVKGVDTAIHFTALHGTSSLPFHVPT